MNVGGDGAKFLARRYGSALIGWAGALCLASGMIAAFAGFRWANGTLTAGAALITAASEIDPLDRVHWGFRAALALVTAVLGVFSIFAT